MSNEYRHNHYVPEWYQKRFIPSEQERRELFYLNLRPGIFIDPRGMSYPRKAVRRQGCNYCFAEKDLYTIKFGSKESQKSKKIF